MRISIILIFNLFYPNIVQVLAQQQISYLGSTCHQCYSKDQGNYCLIDGSYTSGKCCHQSKPTTACKNHGVNKICLSRNRITNGIIGELACPSNTNKCPTAKEDIEINIIERNKQYERSWIWNEPIPIANQHWDCKYVISVPNR